ncbi:MAG: DUF1283 family protein [Enterobacteriaceae bacterium]
MKQFWLKKVLQSTLLLCCLAGWQHAMAAQSCSPGSTCINVNKGDDAYSKEAARQMKEQWDDTRSLRQKVNRFNEKQFDKFDRAVDESKACDSSTNINAYWEPETRRCLDRNTGRPINVR